MPPRSPMRSPQRWRPYLAIWTRPRETIRGIVDTDPTRAVILLAWLLGIAALADNAPFNSHRGYSWVFQATLSVVVGPLLGFYLVYMEGLLVSWTGRWLGGRAGARECRAAVAWSNVPFIATLVLWTPLLCLLGDGAFIEATAHVDANPAARVATWAFSGVSFATLVWSLALKWHCLAEVHGFSTWRGFFTTLLAGLLIVALVVGTVVLALALGWHPPEPAKTPNTADQVTSTVHRCGRDGEAPRPFQVEGGAGTRRDRQRAVSLVTV
jgi:hypothetical protein